MQVEKFAKVDLTIHFDENGNTKATLAGEQWRTEVTNQNPVGIQQIADSAGKLKLLTDSLQNLIKFFKANQGNTMSNSSIGNNGGTLLQLTNLWFHILL